jgi:integrase
VLTTLTDDRFRDHSGAYNHHTTEEVDSMIDSYRPRIPRVYWSTIRPVVVEATRISAPVNPEQAQHVMRIVSLFVLWTWQTSTLPLDVPKIFLPKVIHRFYAVEHSKTRNARAAHASVSKLLEIAEIVHSEAPLRLAIAPRARDAHPYSASDFPWLRSWAASLDTAEYRRAADLTLGLCIGAGLSRAELVEVRTSDIVTGAKGLSVAVRTRKPRLIPIAPAWRRATERGLVGSEPDSFVILPTWSARLAAVSAYTTMLNEKTPEIHRMRTTWIVDLINRVPVGTLVYLAGFSSPRGLDRYMKFAATPTPEDIERSLGEGVSK